MKDIINALSDKSNSNDEIILNSKIDKISIDSRDDFSANTLFIAINGETFDGHDFLEEVYNKGCRFFVVASDSNIKNKKDAITFVYDDTVLAFIKIAREYRLKFNIPIIAITGSAGKTTTKELTALFLSTKYKTLKNEGNLNNEIGVPKSIMKLDSTHEIAVFEAGMNHALELKRISQCLISNLVLINNIEPAHIAYLGSLENIAYAKSELFYNTHKNTTAIFNEDINCKDIVLSECKKNNILNIIEFSKNEVTSINDNSFIYKNVIFTHSLLGEFNTYNILGALKIAEYYDVDIKKCADVLTQYKSINGRMEKIIKNNAVIINDSYNSNFKALMGMIDVLENQKEKIKIAVIGDMLETETENSNYHKQIAEYINNNTKNIDIIFTCGKHSKNIFDGVKIKNKKHFESPSLIFDSLKNYIKEDTVILIKASLGMKFSVLLSDINKI